MWPTDQTSAGMTLVRGISDEKVVAEAPQGIPAAGPFTGPVADSSGGQQTISVMSGHPADAVQRQTVAPISPSGAPLAGTSDGTSNSQLSERKAVPKSPDIDVKALAREVYSVLKRQLLVECEWLRRR